MVLPNSNMKDWEVADVFRLYWREYHKTYGASPMQQKVARAIMRCRTSIMGGHANKCNSCGHVEIAYNSCRDRHCPKCQSTKKLRWVASRKADLLPVPYFHVIFTLPHRLYRLLIYNERLCYDLLFKTVSGTLLHFADRELHGTPGITTILHTWGQNLSRHIHLHCIVTGGALAHDRRRWNRSGDRYLFDVGQLSDEFSKRYIAGLRGASRNGNLRFIKQAGDLRYKEQFEQFLADSKKDDWVVFCQKPFGEPTIVLDYISRYSYRIAISNSRIKTIAHGRVYFSYKDYNDDKIKGMSLSGVDFIKRYLQHVLPHGFTKIRHYGIYAGRDRTEKMACCRDLLQSPDVKKIRYLSVPDLFMHILEIDITLCTVCGVGRMVRLNDQRVTVNKCRGSTAA